MLLSPLMCAGVEKHRTIRVTIKGGEWPNGCHGFFLSVGCRSISAICKRSCYCFMVYRSFPDTLALPGWSWDMVLVTVGVAPRYAQLLTLLCVTFLFGTKWAIVGPQPSFLCVTRYVPVWCDHVVMLRTPFWSSRPLKRGTRPPCPS